MRLAVLLVLPTAWAIGGPGNDRQHDDEGFHIPYTSCSTLSGTAVPPDTSPDPSLSSPYVPSASSSTSSSNVDIGPIGGSTSATMQSSSTSSSLTSVPTNTCGYQLSVCKSSSTSFWKNSLEGYACPHAPCSPDQIAAAVTPFFRDLPQLQLFVSVAGRIEVYSFELNINEFLSRYAPATCPTDDRDTITVWDRSCLGSLATSTSTLTTPTPRPGCGLLLDLCGVAIEGFSGPFIPCGGPNTACSSNQAAASIGNAFAVNPYLQSYVVSFTRVSASYLSIEEMLQRNQTASGSCTTTFKYWIFNRSCLPDNPIPSTTANGPPSSTSSTVPSTPTATCDVLLDICEGLFFSSPFAGPTSGCADAAVCSASKITAVIDQYFDALPFLQTYGAHPPDLGEMLIFTWTIGIDDILRLNSSAPSVDVSCAFTRRTRMFDRACIGL